MLFALSRSFIIFYICYFFVYFLSQLLFLKSPKFKFIQNTLITLGSLSFLYFLIGVSIPSLFILIGGATLCYWGLLHDENSDRSISISFILVCSLILIFLLNKFFKIYPYQFSFSISTVGLSYIILKCIHVLLDNKHGLIKEKSLVGFLNYLFFFPIFISGPIVRYQSFHQEVYQVKTWPEMADQFLSGVKRVIVGLFKLVVVSKFIEPFTFFNINQELLIHSSFIKLVIYANLGLLHLYFNFSGYCDLAIGISSGMGIKIPENFDLPFLSRNMQDLWKRWHMTFGEWLRVYVFFPLNKALFSFPLIPKNSAFITATALVVTFFIMGVFNGLTLNYILHGLTLSLGVVIVFLWTIFLKKRGLTAKYNKIKTIKYVSTFLTFQYFSFCVLFFDANTGEKLQLLIKIIRSYVG